MNGESFIDMGIPPTWEKVVTYLFEPPDFGNLRDGHDPSQLPLPNQILRILYQAHPGMPEMWQGAQGC